MFNIFKKNKKLIMTMLARDEVDIIRQNIEFHLRHGVDFIIATDNGSIDGTRDIMDEYRKKGILYLIDEPGRDKSQAAWNNRMTKMAVEQYGADIIFHCDIDEFWRPKKGDLKTEIISSPADVLRVNLVNVLLEDKDGLESFPEDAKYAVVKPIETDNFRDDSRKDNLYFFRYPQKVMFKAGNGLLEVAQGNHTIANTSGNIKSETSYNIEIFHLPLRGKKRFYHKVIETGKAVEKNVLLGKDSSWHIRRWYEAYQNGTLDEEYKKLTISKEKAEKMKRSKMIDDFDFNNFLST